MIKCNFVIYNAGGSDSGKKQTEKISINFPFYIKECDLALKELADCLSDAVRGISGSCADSQAWYEFDKRHLLH